MHENTFSVSLEKQKGSWCASSVLQDFTLRRSASEYSTIFGLLWAERDVTLSHFMHS